jgi:hypothetical protein
MSLSCFLNCETRPVWSLSPLGESEVGLLMAFWAFWPLFEGFASLLEVSYDLPEAFLTVLGECSKQEMTSSTS